MFSSRTARWRRRAPSSAFTRLWTAAAISDLGDGVTLAAGPLLTLTLTDNAAVVAAAALVQRMPWLLASLASGALVDRSDRRRLLLVTHIGRAALLAGLAIATAAGRLSIPLLFTVLFLHGLGETVADPSANTLVVDYVAGRAVTLERPHQRHSHSRQPVGGEAVGCLALHCRVRCALCA